MERNFLIDLYSAEMNPASLVAHYRFDDTLTTTDTQDVIYRYAVKGCYSAGDDYYEPRVLNPGSIKIMMFADGTTMGMSQIGFGEITLANNDGGLDVLIGKPFSNRKVVISEMVSGVKTQLWSGVQEQPVFTTTTMSIRIKDPQFVFNAALQTTKYLGNNSLPAGVEGSLDLEGKPKPLLFGYCYNAKLVCVNTSQLIYQIHDGALSSIVAVNDKGIALAVGTSRASQAALEAGTPAAGAYDYWLAGGLIKLGSFAVGELTVEAYQGAAAARTPAQTLKMLASRVITSGQMMLADFTALDALSPGTVGINSTDEMTYIQAMDLAVGGLGIWYGFDINSKFRCGRLDAPAGSPVIDLGRNEILALERQPSNDVGRGLPAYKVNQSYAKNWTVQTAGDLAGFVLVTQWTDVSTVAASFTAYVYAEGILVMMIDHFNQQATYFITSTNGINFTNTYFPNETSISTTGITYSATLGIFLASIASYKLKADGYVTAYYDKFLTSTNGSTWTLATNAITGYKWGDITCNSSCVVMVAYETSGGATTTQAAYSTDGSTWTSKTLPSSKRWNSVVWTGSRFVATCALSTYTAYSTDGQTWSAGTVLGSTYGAPTLVYGAGKLICYDKNYSGTYNYYHSSDSGVNWTAANTGGGQITHMTFADGKFSAVHSASGNTRMTSTNGTTWASEVISEASRSYTCNVFGVCWTCGFNSPSYGAVSFVEVSQGVSVIKQSTPNMKVSVSDDTVKILESGAIELNLDTVLQGAGDAYNEATRQLTVRKVNRDPILVKIKRSALSFLPERGMIARITYNRYGYDSGKLFVVIGFEVFLATDDLTIYLWG